MKPLNSSLPEHIAIIDDDRRCLAGIASILRWEGCKCETYESVRSFLDAHAIRRVDCIILDIAMPEINGLAAEKCFRQTNYIGPIVFCSGYPEAEIEDTIPEDAGTGYLQKPVTRESLIRVLQSTAKVAADKQ
jgi:FixJ family two-component response regulator